MCIRDRVNGLRHARIGAIGTRPAGFQTVRASEKLLQASGITVIPVDLSEISAAAHTIEDTDEVLPVSYTHLGKVHSQWYPPDKIIMAWCWWTENIILNMRTVPVIIRWVRRPMHGHI